MSSSNPRIRFPSFAAIPVTLSVITLSVFLAATGCTPAPKAVDKPVTAAPEQPSNRDEAAADIERGGIRFDNIRLTAANYMLDFRYTVTDPEKAALLINRKIKPYLIDESSGTKLYVATPPKVGTLRHTGNNLIAGRSYFALFANPGKYIRSGSKVTVVMGDYRLEDLTVE